jgi:GGDEF domain-containing protein
MIVKKTSPLWPYLEATLALFILYLIDLFITEGHAFRELSFNPLWIVIFLIAGRYGTAPGVFTGFLCACYYFYFGMIESFFYGEFSLTFQDRILMFSFIFFAALLGQMYDRILNAHWQLHADHNDLQDQFNNLLTHHWALQKANIELEKKIVGRQTTMKSLYDIARNLEALEEKALYRGVVDILVRFVRASKCCFFLIAENGRTVLAESHGYSEAEKETLVEKKSLSRMFLAAMVAQSAISFRGNHDEEINLEPARRSLMAVPIRNQSDNKLLGILTIDDAPLLAFNTGNLRILNIVADWTAGALINLGRIAEMKEKEIADEETGVYSFQFFNTRLAEEASRFMRHNTYFSIAVLKINDYEKISDENMPTLHQSLKDVFSRSIRFHDLICRYRDKDMFAILFPLSDEDEGRFNLKRLHNNISMLNLKPYGNDNPLTISIYYLTVRENEPEPMYRLKPEQGAEIVKKAIEKKIENNETYI